LKIGQKKGSAFSFKYLRAGEEGVVKQTSELKFPNKFLIEGSEDVQP